MRIKSFLKLDKPHEGCYPGMKLNLALCENCPKKIKHWEYRGITGQGGIYKNDDEFNGEMLFGYPELPDEFVCELSDNLNSIMDDKRCIIFVDDERILKGMRHNLVLPHQWFLSKGNYVLANDFQVTNCPLAKEHAEYSKQHPDGGKFNYKYRIPWIYTALAPLVSFGFYEVYKWFCLYFKL